MTEKEILEYALKNGIIELDTIQAQIEMEKRQEILNLHTQKVWQDPKGRWTTYLPMDNGRKLIKKTKYEDLENAIYEFYRAQNPVQQLTKICREWLQKKFDYGEIERQSFDRYVQDSERFFASDPINTIPFEDIDEMLLEDFIKRTIHDKKLTAKAWRGMKHLLNGAFKYGRKHGYTDFRITDFFDELELSRKAFDKRKKTDEESVFTDKEIEMISKRISGKPDNVNLGILFIFESGLRVGELSALKRSDLKGNVLDVTRTEIKYKDDTGKHYIFDVRERTKGAEGSRRVVLTAEGVEIFKAIQDLNPNSESEFLFVDKAGERIKSQVFTNRLYRMCDSLGITRRSSHKIRKTYATKLLNCGIDEKLIESQMGHTDIATTKQYYYFNNKDSEESQKIIETAIGNLTVYSKKDEVYSHIS